jgi:hypothetical protein
MCISYLKLKLSYFTNGFFFIYLISCIYFLGVNIFLPFRNFIPDILKDIHVVENTLGHFLFIYDSLSHVYSSNCEFLQFYFTSETFLFPSSFSLRYKIFTCFTSNVKSSLISIRTCGRSHDGSIYAFLSNDTWNKLCTFSKYGGNLNL